MLIAKGVVDTLAIDPHVLHQILDRRALVTAHPEHLHRFVENFIWIELFLSRHSCCLGHLLYSFWNEQSRIQYQHRHTEARIRDDLNPNCRSPPSRTVAGGWV